LKGWLGVREHRSTILPWKRPSPINTRWVGAPQRMHTPASVSKIRSSDFVVQRGHLSLETGGADDGFGGDRASPRRHRATARPRRARKGCFLRAPKGDRTSSQPPCWEGRGCRAIGNALAAATSGGSRQGGVEGVGPEGPAPRAQRRPVPAPLPALRVAGKPRWADVGTGAGMLRYLGGRTLVQRRQIAVTQVPSGWSSLRWVRPRVSSSA
jgi:hypothetical protein